MSMDWQHRTGRRAFSLRVHSRLLMALALSVVLHAVLVLPRRPMPLRDAVPPRVQIEIRMAAPRLGAAPPQARAGRPAELASASSAITRPPESTAKTEALPTSDAVKPPDPPPSNVLGVAIAPQLLIPFSGKTPLWSSGAAQQQDAAAAYLAQRQHQALLNQQVQMRAARGQYEARLLESLRRQRVSGSCRIVLPDDGAPRMQCDQTTDTALIVAVLREAGEVPRVEKEETWMVIALAPSQTDSATQLTSERFDHDPDR